MAIATGSQFWTSRLLANDPTAPVGANNDTWAVAQGAKGSANGDFWRITNGVLRQTHSSDSLTIMAAFKFSTAPSNGDALLYLDNGSHKVEVRSKGNMQSLDLVGASTVTTHDLDLDMQDLDAVPILLRLTLASDGTANLYMREITEDDNGAHHYLSVTGASGSTAEVKWGNTSGAVDWSVVYFTHHGAFSPDEMDLSDWVTTSFIRTGLNVVQTLKDSKRHFIKNHVTDSSIVYGYDVSSSMTSRVRQPSIHVVMSELSSPGFLALAGGRTEQEYKIMVYVTTRGTNYKDAYRLGLSITGEVFDELYTNTGLNAGVDSLTGYSIVLDTKMDEDEVICVHMMCLDYMKKVNMTRREA